MEDTIYINSEAIAKIARGMKNLSSYNNAVSEIYTEIEKSACESMCLSDGLPGRTEIAECFDEIARCVDTIEIVINSIENFTDECIILIVDNVIREKIIAIRNALNSTNI